MVSLAREELLMASPNIERGRRTVNCTALPGKRHSAAHQFGSNSIRDGPILQNMGASDRADVCPLQFQSQFQVRKG